MIEWEETSLSVGTANRLQQIISIGNFLPFYLRSRPPVAQIFYACPKPRLPQPLKVSTCCLIFFPFCLIFFPFFKKVFVTNFITRITKFVTYVRKFVTCITKFVINFFCQIVKIIKEEGKICSVSVIFLRFESGRVVQNVPTHAAQAINTPYLLAIL